MEDMTMAVNVIELHHHGIRVSPESGGPEKALAFYRDVLGLEPDPGRPQIAAVPGFWMEVGGRAQIHLMGVEGTSSLARGPEQDPTSPHVALAVPDIQEARRELERLGVPYWSLKGVTGPGAEQIFVTDPAGNMVELHQAGTCRCSKATTPPRT
jgi:catechol 2,3-dioxygenase-like lactoylglutathione lyase family enzyme